MKNKSTKKIYIIAILLAFIVCICTLLQSAGLEAYAANSTITPSSAVLDDLQTDENFSVFDYPANPEDYSIKVIQVAEDSAGNAYIYTHQPCLNSRLLIATQVNMSFTDSVNDTDLYTLILIGYTGVFAKYLLIGQADHSSNVRYYNITSVYRGWIKDIDNSASKESMNNISAVSFPVGQLWTVTQNGDDLYYNMTETTVIEITDKYVGYIKKTAIDMPWWSVLAFNADWKSWYIAFDTDMQIDKLLSATVSYTYFAYYFGLGDKYDTGLPITFDIVDIGRKKAEITYDEKRTFPSSSHPWGSNTKYEFYRIQSVENFLSSENINEDRKSNFEGKKWILRFTETCVGTFDFIDSIPLGMVDDKIIDTSVLRLEFETEGIHYNLGVVDNKQGAGSNQPPDRVIEDEKIGFFAYIWRCIVRLFNGTANLWETFVAIAVIVVIALIIPLILTILSIAFPAFGSFMVLLLKFICKALLFIVKAVWWLISLPFKGIAYIFIRRRQKKQKQKQKIEKIQKKNKEKTEKIETRNKQKTEKIEARNKQKTEKIEARNKKKIEKIQARRRRRKNA